VIEPVFESMSNKLRMRGDGGSERSHSSADPPSLLSPVFWLANMTIPTLPRGCVVILRVNRTAAPASHELLGRHVTPRSVH
jgi:hypothetical protein